MNVVEQIEFYLVYFEVQYLSHYVTESTPVPTGRETEKSLLTRGQSVNFNI